SHHSDSSSSRSHHLSISLLSSLYPSFLLHRHFPTSPLFPYTTLFRSSMGSANGPVEKMQCRTAPTPCPEISARIGYAIPARNNKDRKSTRLNSSHGSISYAVFCLKKKKKKDRRTTERERQTTQTAADV